MAEAFSVDKCLARFFPDPLAFRRIQARTSTLISGSFALQLFDRTSYPSSDLDLYLHLEHRRTVGRWLIDEAGYSFFPYRGQEEDFESAVLHKTSRRGISYAMPGVADILTFRKGHLDDAILKVQLIVARRTPMEVVLGFHSMASFTVRYDTYDGVIMTFSVLRSDALQYRYALGDEDLADYLSCILGFKKYENLNNLACGLEDVR
ncbi:hypothetical protein GSI_05535 [Ganoderma sinense ZZ0214-1]|uniref:Uncharacterized protein n=1 Tax=Ganoderma sinense ZZ0214-1 TaxID=1077348 RepID=A0A2G8SEV1_9APHY|nr:hypothetical protein GSI_05535 [Ganoderma sinense ZZ0214-1]